MKFTQFQLLYLTKHAFYKLRSFSYSIKYRSIHLYGMRIMICFHIKYDEIACI